MTSKPPLASRYAERLDKFNQIAADMIDSSYVKEAKEKKLGMTYNWKQNKQTGELDFSYQRSGHNEDVIRSFILSLRLIIQDNEPTSIRNMAHLYEEMPIGSTYKHMFVFFRKQFNDYMDERAMTLLNDNPSRRQIYDTIIYGKYAHKNSEKQDLIKKWQTEPVDWDMTMSAFELTLHDFVTILEYLSTLNKQVLNDHEIIM